MAVLPRTVLGPSACLLFICRWGMIRSSRSKKRIPSQNPPAAGKTAQGPMRAACSMAGMSRLQTDAATITPAAKPVRPRWIKGCGDLPRKNTLEAPRDVPRNGMRMPRHAARDMRIFLLPYGFRQAEWRDSSNSSRPETAQYGLPGGVRQALHTQYTLLPSCSGCGGTKLSLFSRCLSQENPICVDFTSLREIGKNLEIYPSGALQASVIWAC